MINVEAGTSKVFPPQECGTLFLGGYMASPMLQRQHVLDCGSKTFLPEALNPVNNIELLSVSWKQKSASSPALCFLNLV
jgi:hypothetical protein